MVVYSLPSYHKRNHILIHVSEVSMVKMTWSKLDRAFVVLVFVVVLCFAVSDATKLGDGSGSGVAKRRVRRVLGAPTRCAVEFQKFCQLFKKGVVTKRYCILAPVRLCSAVDK